MCRKAPKIQVERLPWAYISTRNQLSVEPLERENSLVSVNPSDGRDHSE
jgi:hypothetical protein